MMLLLSGWALAGACCTTSGAMPVHLDSCERLGIVLEGSGRWLYGGWGWDGSWATAGEDGGGDLEMSATLIGRVTPWLQAGIRLPYAVEMSRLDGKPETRSGAGDGLLWLELETATSPKLAVDLGVRRGGLLSEQDGVWAPQVAVNLSQTEGAWQGWGGLQAAYSAEQADLNLGGGVDHELGRVLRLGLGAGGNLVPGPVPSFSLSMGPSLTIMPDHKNRLLLSAQAAGLGRNTEAHLALRLNWFRLLV